MDRIRLDCPPPLRSAVQLSIIRSAATARSWLAHWIWSSDACARAGSVDPAPRATIPAVNTRWSGRPHLLANTRLPLLAPQPEKGASCHTYRPVQWSAVGAVDDVTPPGRGHPAAHAGCADGRSAARAYFIIAATLSTISFGVA